MSTLQFRGQMRSIVVATAMCGLMFLGWAGSEMPAKEDTSTKAHATRNPHDVAAEVDRIILEELKTAGVEATPATNDQDYLRRVSLDLTGTIPSASEVTLFALDPDPDKRAKLVDRLLESDEFCANWTRYWRDVIYMRATEQRSRLSQGAFESWMTTQLKEHASWDQIATSLLTATGDVRENGQTALMFAQGGQPEEIAAETARIFLGIQIQCANCHDHPTDKWKRKDFHELAAFFPRVSVKRRYEAQEMPGMDAMEPDAKKKGKKYKTNKKKAAETNLADAKKRQGLLTFEIASFVPRTNNLREEFFLSPERAIRRLDTNRDKLLSRDELERTPAARVFDRLLEQADDNKDQKLSADEIKKVRPPENPGKGAAEYMMADLKDPASPGTRIDPAFFLTGASPKKGLDDVERRALLAKYITSHQNVWFARSYVNRMWGEMLGAGFYNPIDDLGPERTAVFPKALDILADGFAGSGYDIRWLFRTITATAAYQRQVRHNGETSPETVPFAAAIPKRLRADQVYDSIAKVAGGEQLASAPRNRGDRKLGVSRTPRGQFEQLFNVDPSTPQEEIIGTVPQALFLMNSPSVNRLVESRDGSKLKKILDENSDDADAVNEMYLLVLGRTASETEVKTCVEYRNEVGNRSEAFEDIFWGLLNSSEFLSQR